jgi:hypothetical protein
VQNYKVTRYVKEVYYVLADSKEQALKDVGEYGGPVEVHLIKETVIKEK